MSQTLLKTPDQAVGARALARVLRCVLGQDTLLKETWEC